MTILWQGQDLNASSSDPEDDIVLPTTLTYFPGTELRYPRDCQHVGKASHQRFNFPLVIPRGTSTRESAYL